MDIRIHAVPTALRADMSAMSRLYKPPGRGSTYFSVLYRGAYDKGQRPQNHEIIGRLVDGR